MKRFFLFLSLAAFLSPCIAQQQKQRQWQLRLGGGYDFSTASQRMLSQMINISGEVNSKTVNSSLGRGVGFNVDITRWVNRYLGFTAGAAWHNTLPPVKGESSNPNLNFKSEENTLHSNTLLATAGIAIKIPDTKLNPYARIGMLLPVYSRLTSDDDWQNFVVLSTYSRIITGTAQKVYQLHNTVGYSAAVGIAPSLSKHIAVFSEINFQSLSMLARHSTMTSFKQNGIEKINTFSVYGKETDYIKEIDINHRSNGDAPQQQLAFSFPYSSIGIHIGVSFTL